MSTVNNLYFAQVYGGGTYNSSAYAAAGTSSGTGASGSVLTNTGFDLMLACTLACVVIFAALVVRFWKRPKKTGAATS